MAANSLKAVVDSKKQAKSEMGELSHDLLRRHHTNEIFIAVVGPAGAGAGTAAKILKSYLERAKVGDDAFTVEVIKASDSIKSWAESKGLQVPTSSRKSIDAMVMMQDRGDDMRRISGDNAAVARAMIEQIMAARAKARGVTHVAGEPVVPDGKPRAYILDSLRHPAEAMLLRELYQDSFALLGVVCDPDQRDARLRHNLFDRKEWGSKKSVDAVNAFMGRDANAPQKFGQHVTDTFHQSDYFVDNSHDASDELSMTGMNDSLIRLVDLMTSSKVVRPTISETSMHHAASAQYRSACMSRQVGAALVDRKGNIVSTGTNEVPMAGGGVYGERFSASTAHDERCVFRESKFCSSNKEQNEIIAELIVDFPELLSARSEADLVSALRKTRIGGLIEFSRAVHAEMDAILSAARTGVSPEGCRLFVTAFPCHYCARHIISAGVEEVQYIEPYPKSRALALHKDAITTDVKGWIPAGGLPRSLDEGTFRVLFRPFEGVAPRMYERVFVKDREYKDRVTGDFSMGSPEWGGPVNTFTAPYSKLEAELSRIE